MRSLINFLIKNVAWFVFIFLEAICFYFIFTENAYQKSVFLNSSNEISGRTYGLTANVISFFNLGKENEDLLLANAKLQRELAGYKHFVEALEFSQDSIYAYISENNIGEDFDVIRAKVVNNSVARTINFITINKGKNQGVKEEMGVVSHQGLVGIVRTVSSNYSVVQPVLNPDTKLNCKVLESNVQGTLIWEGGDPRYASVINYPRFEVVNIGDSIVTSGYSHVFPEGIYIGKVHALETQAGDNFYKLEIELGTDFSSLRNVIIVDSRNKDEKISIENKVKNATR